MRRLRSTTLLSLGSQSIDVPSPGMRIPIISHPMTEFPPDVRSLIYSSLLPWGAVRFPEPTATLLSRPPLTACRLLSHLPRLRHSVSSATSPTSTSGPEDICRDRHGDTNVVGIVDMRTSLDKDVPHHPSTLFRH
ncbi:hypothetical protein M405DRAFT_829662 [Rhizopogon salebrosus TDB-379]|nr:hypothetical protein M405DRAFT_829662 [Rhizopogon salebrosus TDB-379]